MKIEVTKNKVITGVILSLWILWFVSMLCSPPLLQNDKEVKLIYPLPYSEVFGVFNNSTIMSEIPVLEFETSELTNQTIKLSISSNIGVWELGLYDTTQDKFLIENKTIPIQFTKHLVVRGDKENKILFGLIKNKEYYWEPLDRYRVIMIGKNISKSTPVQVRISVISSSTKEKITLIIDPFQYHRS